MTLEERRKVNYDHPDSLENDLLVKHLKMLLNGEAIDKQIDLLTSMKMTEKQKEDVYLKALNYYVTIFIYCYDYNSHKNLNSFFIYFD